MYSHNGAAVTMPLPQTPLEIMLIIARQLIDDDGELSYTDCNSFLMANRVLYVCLNRARWNPAVQSEIATDRVFMQLISTVSLRRLRFLLELGADVEMPLQVQTAMTGCIHPARRHRFRR
jgi:hypothetical protein